MPIIIDKSKNGGKPEYSPKYFSSLLTGNGKRQGFLNESFDHRNDRLADGRRADLQYHPANNNSVWASPYTRCPAKHTHTDTVDDYLIPFTNLIALSDNATVTLCDTILNQLDDKNVLAVYDNKAGVIWYSIPLYGHFTKYKSTHISNTLKVMYVHIKEANGQLTDEIAQSTSPFKPLQLEDNLDPAFEVNYSVHKAISIMSELMQTKFNGLTREYINTLVKNGEDKPFVSLRQLTDFELTFEQYSELFADIQTWLPTTNMVDKDALNTIVLSNMHLLMLDAVRNLAKDKANHVHITNPPQDPKLADFLSPSQLEAAITKEPFVLVQAGAGTGKSTTIIERIKYMEQSGINPHDIRVLSLTNAAANNILEKDARLQSTTIAKYISDIYRLNYPKQEIVEYTTLKNTIMIYANHKPNARQFRNLLRDDYNIELLQFIQDNYDEVVEILDITGQTTLQIQAFISYLKAESFNYGDDTASHFIVDETQDNNVFEFIYLMKIAALRKASVYIVGDASQTLYEFRGASAEALNAIETSGYFECIKLDINYRSNQYILDFANATLADISVNRFAQIQLQADNFKQLNSHEFKTTVAVKQVSPSTMREFDESFDANLTLEAEPYVRHKTDKKEKVALLARSGMDVHRLQQWAEKQFPNKTVVNLVPKRVYSSSLFSSYVNRYWDDLMLTPKSIIKDVIRKDIMEKARFLQRGKHETILKNAQFQLDKWCDEQKGEIDYLQKSLQFGQKSIQDVMLQLRDSLVQFEIKYNTIRQRLLKQQQDQEDKNELINKADIIVSTVHSVKGLEFDNVVFLHRSPVSKSHSEEEKRIDYVALTRGRKSELIIDVAPKQKSSKLNDDYNALIAHYTDGGTN